HWSTTTPYTGGSANPGGKLSMRYVLSVASHYLTGKLTTGNALYALRERPVAVASKGKTWVIDPDFKG
ncbi:hypothetical protein MWU71_005982, partial [Pseudomonas aeruginosa]